ncbi:hypothetical protein GXM_01904 [Nostoc sphaeroides CCNUC1]|uniref:Uncharacterized protein n=1 Tax=Nostoc sphaeroides CCNUC1 TaxID=2653204 RepID=A0A5P8VX05_9NOSO|nr:hypothetical protein GXM_01904 [Nostoc sphaeroides CCNUC1]
MLIPHWSFDIFSPDSLASNKANYQDLRKNPQINISSI